MVIGMSGRVALVENNLILSSKVSSLLKSLGYEVKVVQRWKALEEVLEGNPILVIINGEGLEGLEPLRRLKERYPSTPAVVYCSHRNTELQRKAKDLGAEAVVPNSAIVSQLKEILESIL